MMNNDEQDLQRRFEAWSAQEKHAAPDFERVWRRAERAAVDSSGGFRLWPRFAVVAAVVALGAAGLWWSVRDGNESWEAQLAAFESEMDALPPMPPAGPEPGAWELPTDFLLAGTDDDPNSKRIHR